MKKILDKWEVVSRILVVVQFIVLLLSTYFTLGQIKDLKNSGYMEYALKFDDKLFNGDNGKIAIAIQRNKPILKDNGGRFEDYDLDSYLGLYDQINDAYKMKLISKDLIYNDFSDALIDAYKNKEVQGYLIKIRKEDPTYFDGFDKLARICLEYQSQNK